MSTFSGLELAKKALAAQQGALYTTGHNIANVNTPGYSRQRVNFETSQPFPTASRVMPQLAGQIGTGVEIGTVQRLRNQFLDIQFRGENSRSQYWDTRSESLSRMEGLFTEPSDTGLNEMMDSFWQSLQDMADDPSNDGARSVVAQRALALTETFNHLSNSLQSIRQDLNNEIEVSTKNINSLLERINHLNEQIQKIEPHGMLANDLYDERDRLVDELSGYMNIKVHHTASSNSALGIADGLVSIEIVDNSGQSSDPPVFLVDARDNKNLIVNELAVSFDASGNEVLSGVTVAGLDATDIVLASNGTLNALIEAYGYDDQGKETGLYTEMLSDLDKMAQAFATAFNNQHKLGVDVDGNTGGAFFVTSTDDSENGITAGNITLNEAILKDPNLIAAAGADEGTTNNYNALEMAKIFDLDLSELDGHSTRDFYKSIIGELGVKGQKATTMKNSTAVLREQIEYNRLSVTAVSLDEEVSNMIKFQHAYNAAARSMTAMDEMIDRIINNLGLVGR